MESLLDAVDCPLQRQPEGFVDPSAAQGERETRGSRSEKTRKGLALLFSFTGPFSSRRRPPANGRCPGRWGGVCRRRPGRSRAALDFAFGWVVRWAKIEAGSTLAPRLRQRRVRDWSLVMTVQDFAVLPRHRRDPFRDDVVGGAAAAPDDLDAAEPGGHAGALGPVEDHHHLLALARPGEEGGEDRLRCCAPPPPRPALRRDSRRRSARASGASHSLRLHPNRHQILQTFSRTIGWPGLQEKAWANSGMLATTPLIRQMPGLCGFVAAESRSSSGRWFSHTHCAKPTKKRCSGERPSFALERLAGDRLLPRLPGEDRPAEIGDVLAQRQLAVDLEVVDDRVLRVLVGHALRTRDELLRVLLRPPVLEIAGGVELAALRRRSRASARARSCRRCCRSSGRRPSSGRRAAAAGPRPGSSCRSSTRCSRRSPSAASSPTRRGRSACRSAPAGARSRTRWRGARCRRSRGDRPRAPSSRATPPDSRSCRASRRASRGRARGSGRSSSRAPAGAPP